MRTIFVDDEPWAMRKFQKLCAQIQDIDMIGTFANPREALDFAREHVVDFAVLDIDMPQMSGLTLGKALRALYPEIVLVYVTAHDRSCWRSPSSWPLSGVGKNPEFSH